MNLRKANAMSKKKGRPKQPSKSHGAPQLIRLPLTGALVPTGYDVHGSRPKRWKMVGSGSANDTVRGAELPSHDQKNALAGTVGKRPATNEDVHAIAEIVRAGGNPGQILGRVFLNESQRKIISGANHQPLSIKKLRKIRAKANDIYRRGKRLSGSFQSTC
jgi:hypothetical protein